MSASKSAHRSSIGCLGLLMIVLLALGSAGELALIFHLDPEWLDQRAFWRPPPYPPDQLTVDDPQERAGIETEIEAEIAARKVPEKHQQVELIPQLAAAGRYEPASGASIEALWGGKLTVPAGAVDQACEISMVPVRYLADGMAMANLGPIVDLNIGEHAHYSFAQPVDLTLPYDQESGEEPVIVVWQGDQWNQLATSINPDGTVSASLSHASVIGVAALAKILVAAGGGFAVVSSAVSMSWLEPLILARTLGNAAFYAGAISYESSFFTIFYYTSGEHAVISDSAYPVSRSREPEAGVPLFVQDLADFFNEARSHYRDLGYDMGRSYVFVSRMDSAGDARPGGPIFISSQIVEQALADGADVELELRATAAHELLHVAQASWFSIAGAYRDRWWLEATGAYMGDRLWRLQGRDTNVVGRFFMRRGGTRLLTFAMDTSTDPQYYAYASFLNWLDQSHDDAGFKVFSTVNQGGNAAIESIDQAVSAATKMTLGEAITEFAKELYYRDLWRGRLLAELHSGLARVQAESESNDPMDLVQTYKLVNLNMVRGQKTIWYYHETASLESLPHLTAWPFYFGVQSLDKKRGGKLVVLLEPHGQPAEELDIYLAADYLGPTLPAAGSPSGLSRQELSSSPSTWVLDRFDTDGGRDRVSLIAVNSSTQEAIAGFDLSRWVLLRPEHVDFKRKRVDEPSSWMITWDPSELEETPVFLGYNVYRRLPGEVDSEAVLVTTDGPVRQLELRHEAPDDREYVYTVTVLDIYRNESHHSLVEPDPFQGIWNGEIAIKEGSLVRLCQPYIDSLLDEEQIDAEDRELRQQLESWAENLDAIARLGIPLELQIERYVGDRYFVQGNRVMWMEPDEKQRIEMRRTGDRTLELIEPGENGANMILRITHPDQMREPHFELKMKIGIGEEASEETWALRWKFRRKKMHPKWDEVS
jgi:hypothetical protein